MQSPATKLHAPLFTSFREAFSWLRTEEKRLTAAIRRFESMGCWAYADECEDKLRAVQHRINEMEDEAQLWGPERC